MVALVVELLVGCLVGLLLLLVVVVAGSVLVLRLPRVVVVVRQLRGCAGPLAGLGCRCFLLRRAVFVVCGLVVVLVLACVLPRSWLGIAAALPVFGDPTSLACLVVAAAVVVVVVAGVALSGAVLECAVWVCWLWVCAAAASAPGVVALLEVMEVTGL